MLGVSQPGSSCPVNPPSSLRHSASFSCLQRSTASEGHRARTSTLLQQPGSLGNSTHHQYSSGQASLQSSSSSTASSSGNAGQHRTNTGELPLEPTVQDGNDYGFVRIRPRLRSTNATIYHEEEVAAAKSSFRDHDASAFSDRECDSNFRDCSIKSKDHHHHHHRDHSPKGAKNQNPLRGALILFTSTSSWWKARQREEQLNASSSTVVSSAVGSSVGNSVGNTVGTTGERKWSSTSIASPSNERKWPPPVTSPTNDRKWSVGNSLLMSPSNERKWNRSSVSSTGQQDRKWRSLGALLRAPTGGGSTGTSTGSSHAVQNSLSHNMSVSMIEGDHFREDLRGLSSCKPTRYQQPTSYSARVSRVSRDIYRENGEFGQAGRSKISRRLYQDGGEGSEREISDEKHQNFEEEYRSRANNRESVCRADQSGETRTATSTRSSRAQSFYLLDDFLRPQPQQSKCMLNLYLPSSYSKSNDHGRTEIRQAPQGNVTNITPPRRHNSSSDSLEVAASPLPPPVPPPPPQVTTRERERNENFKEKDVCPCKMCWTNMQQRSFVEEISYEVPSYGTKGIESTEDVARGLRFLRGYASRGCIHEETRNGRNEKREKGKGAEREQPLEARGIRDTICPESKQ